MSSSRSRGTIAVVALVLLGAAGALGFVGWSKLARQEPLHFADPAEQFKYGPIGNMDAQGMPYYVWLVLPRVFREYVPGNGGYAAFGFKSEPAHEVPVGLARQTIGFPRVSFNCAICHSASFRTSADAAPTIAPGGPGHTQDTQAYLQFLFACASDARFTADVLMPEIEQNVHLSLIDELLYRHVLIPATRKALLQQKQANAWMATRPRWGPGRIDPFNPVKIGLLGMKVDDTIGNADNMSIWSMKSRVGQRLHWDGMNDTIHEVVLTSALGDGATLKSIPLADLKVLEAFLMDVQPPRYPGPVDAALAERGKTVFTRLCQDCHGEGGKITGKVVRFDEIGTDPERHRLWGQEAADRYNAYAEAYPFDFDHWVATNGPEGGYSSTPLTGIWLRAPYLHNGSVPSLVDLFAEPYGDDLPVEVKSLATSLAALPPTELRKHTDELRVVEEHVKAARAAGRRPALYFRGLDLVDFEHVGFVSDRSSLGEEPQPFLYDTRLPGNGQRGHVGERYGTTLPAEEKSALIEYLKTL